MSATVNASPSSNQIYNVSGTDANGCQSSTLIIINVNSCNGIESRSNDNAGISVFPNPSTGAFTVKSGSEIDLAIVDELGRLVKTISLNASNGYSMQVKDLRAGVYFVSRSGAGPGSGQKIVIAE